MGLDKFIQFIIHNNETIILLTVATILILSGVVIYLNVFKQSETAPSTDLTGIEETLKRILAQTNVAIGRTEETAGATEASAGESVGTPVANADLEALKIELEQRKKTIEELQSEIKKAKSSDASAELLAKIKTLEGKLAEYEIIEDDIADLSHYKDENARLKKELDILKKKAGPELVDAFATAATEATASPEPTEAAPADPEQQLEDLVSKAQAEITPESKTDDGRQVGEVFTAEDLKSKPKIKPSEKAAEKLGENLEATNMEAEPAPETQAAAPAAPPTESDEEPKTDIFAEFSSGGGETDPLAELGDIDTNKMLEELQGLQVDMNAGAEAVHETPDIEKMAEEAQSLGKEK